MFGDDTNLFFAHLDIRYLFQTVNQVNQSMVYSKYAFTKYKKTNYLFFHKPGQKKDDPLLFPKLIINHYETKRKESITFSGLLLNENLNLKEHIKYNEKKANNSGFLDKAKHYLNKRSLLVL